MPTTTEAITTRISGTIVATFRMSTRKNYQKNKNNYGRKTVT